LFKVVSDHRDINIDKFTRKNSNFGTWLFFSIVFFKIIADDAIRTRDIGLGRTTLYRLSYIRAFLKEEGARPVGLEPTTSGFGNQRSTN